MKIPASLLTLALLIPIAAPASQDLLETYRQAAQNDPELGAADAGLQAAREGRPQARSALLPKISATANVAGTHSAGYGGYDSRGFTVTVTQSLYDHKNQASLRAADADAARSESEYNAVAQDLILRVAQAYFDVLGATDSVEFVRAEKKAIARQLEQARKRFEVGLIAITDVHEAQAQYDLATASEITALNEVDSANEALRQITERTPEALAPLGETLVLSRPDPDDLGVWTERALENNPSLKALAYARDAAQEAIETAKATFYPSLSLVGSQTHTWANGGPGDGSNDDTKLALQLSAPIFEGFARGSQVSEAEFNYMAAEENYERERRAVVRAATDAFRGVGAQLARIKALEQALVSSRSALKATRAGFDVGTRTIVDVLDAERNMHSAVRDLKRARYDYILSQLTLFQAAGHVGEEHLTVINAWLQ